MKIRCMLCDKLIDGAAYRGYYDKTPSAMHKGCAMKSPISHKLVRKYKKHLKRW